MKNTNQREGIPTTARLVFKGVIFEVWQWQQEMFDGSKQTFEKIWRPPTVEVIATVNDKILIEYQDQPNRKDNINLPSGRADQNDDLLNEAKRELLEETGYQSDDWELFLHHGRDGKVIHEIYYFIARNCKKIQEPQLEVGEKIETKLIDFENFIKLKEKNNFRVSPEFKNYLLQISVNQKAKDDFKKLLFK